VVALGAIELALVCTSAFLEKRKGTQAGLLAERLGNESHVVEAATTHSSRICGNPCDGVCPEPPLKGNGLRDELGEQGREAMLVRVLIGDDEAPRCRGEFERTTSLGKGETLRFVDGSALRADELAKRGTTARTGQLLIDARQVLCALGAQQGAELLATGATGRPNELESRAADVPSAMLDVIYGCLNSLHYAGFLVENLLE
jgi:hypothetical protein